MRAVVIAGISQKQELESQGLKEGLQVNWLEEIAVVEGADCYIDLLFTKSPERIEQLKQLQPAFIIINDVITTSAEIPENFVSINGWPGFLQRSIMEASCTNEAAKKTTAAIFTLFNRTTAWVPGTTGFISARVVSMIINEAYLTLEEGVSTKEEIDIAMKLGTNYPYGPFEWGEKIGLRNICRLLTTMSGTDNRYQPAPVLEAACAKE